MAVGEVLKREGFANCPVDAMKNGRQGHVLRQPIEPTAGTEPEAEKLRTKYGLVFVSALLGLVGL